MMRVSGMALLCMLGFTAWVRGMDVAAVSPNGECSLTLSWQEGALTYRVQGQGLTSVETSRMGYRLASGASLPGPGWELE